MKLVRLMRLFGIIPKMLSKMTMRDLYHLQHTVTFEFTVVQCLHGNLFSK